MRFILQILLLIYTNSLHVQYLDKTEVVASLYDTVTLRCWFPFINGSEGLSVVWEKIDQDGRGLIMHRFMNNQDNLTEQDINYTGRTQLCGDFSQGRVDLTLREVIFNDEGTYYCRAANKGGHGDKIVVLTIDNRQFVVMRGYCTVTSIPCTSSSSVQQTYTNTTECDLTELNAEDPGVTAIHIDGKKCLKCLKCINIGVFRNPWIRWYDDQRRDLSEHGTRNITDIGNGWKMVESVLDLDVEKNKPYFCLVKEGRLKRTVRAVLSDGEPVTIAEIKLPE